jgi:Na+/H+-dicarboxylate symporter/ABC-type amino acid transport substrate-binding protein
MVLRRSGTLRALGISGDTLQGMSFTLQILLGLVAGIFTGLFLGEIAAPLSVAGQIFIALLQMTVLPYIVVSLMGNLGRISWSESRGILLAAMSVLAVLLLLGVVVLITAPLAFPKWATASFFSASLVQSPQALDLIALYIPANPFNSLANNVVPAAVLFSILVGIGLSGVRGNGGLLQGLDVVADALNRVNKMIIKVTPLGVFAIASGLVGTVVFEEISRLQAYLITYTVVAMLLSFLVLPLMVSAVTPFGYRDLVSIPRDTLITIFATAKIIVVLPQLVENVKELFRKYDLEDEETGAGAEILLPLAYPFPNLGTYSILMFVPFSAWYLGHSFDFSDHLMFQAGSVLSSFVAPIIGIPFLLDMMQLPADMMELFVMSTVYTDRIRVVLGAMHLLSLAIVAIAIKRGVFRVNLPKLARAGGLSLLVVLASLLLIRGYLDQILSDSYKGDYDLIEMRWMDSPVDVRVYMDSLPAVEPEVAVSGRLDVIEQRGTLRVGFLSDSLPFAFRNEAGEVIGFDIEMGHHLANDLGVGLELVRIERDDVNQLFDTGQIDIVMSGLAVTPDRIRYWNFSPSPIDLTLGFLVRDYRRNEFRSVASLQKMPKLRLAVIQFEAAFIQQTQMRFPNVELEAIGSPRPFLRGERPDLDGVIYSAEGGSAWTLIYPDFTVVVPQPSVSKVPMAYPLPFSDPTWTRYVSEWVTLKQKNGTIDALFEHWIKGTGAAIQEPRWSVIRNVLHWVD